MLLLLVGAIVVVTGLEVFWVEALGVLADHPEKVHRATRYIASLALAGAFPCKAGK